MPHQHLQQPRIRNNLTPFHEHSTERDYSQTQTNEKVNTDAQLITSFNQ